MAALRFKSRVRGWGFLSDAATFICCPSYATPPGLSPPPPSPHRHLPGTEQTVFTEWRARRNGIGPGGDAGPAREEGGALAKGARPVDALGDDDDELGGGGRLPTRGAVTIAEVGLLTERVNHACYETTGGNPINACLF